MKIMLKYKMIDGGTFITQIFVIEQYKNNLDFLKYIKKMLELDCTERIFTDLYKRGLLKNKEEHDDNK